MEPHAFNVLGGLDKPTDARDIPLGAVTSPTYTFPKVFSNSAAWNAPVENQGQQPACGAHAGAKLNDIQLGIHSTPRYTWNDIKTFDGFPVEAGTDLRSVLKSPSKSGTADFALLGNDVTLSLNEYAHAALNASVVANALLHKAPGYGFITDHTFNGLKQYIWDHGALVILIRVSARLWTAADGTLSWAEKDILPLAPASAQFPIVGGHFVVAHSYDENYIYFINSFGNTWGQNGHGYFGPNYMPQVIDGGTFIKLAFNKDLYYGITDPQVKALQVILNKNSATQVAVSGPGSPGLETEYLGNLTKAAVIKFQNLNNIHPAQGYVGPLTRAVLNTK